MSDYLLRDPDGDERPEKVVNKPTYDAYYTLTTLPRAIGSNVSLSS